MVNFDIIILFVKTIDLKKIQRPKFCGSKKKNLLKYLGTNLVSNLESLKLIN
jgi:hypothetical protein